MFEVYSKFPQSEQKQITIDTQLVRNHLADGRIVRWKDLIGLGVKSSSLASMVRKGVIERSGWGSYQIGSDHRLAVEFVTGATADEDDSSFLEEFAEVSVKSPGSVICLVSAAAYHELVLDVPHQVWLGLAHGRHAPQLDYPPVKPIAWRNPNSLTAGVRSIHYRGMQIPVTGPERTVVDLYRYHNLPDPQMPRKALSKAIARPDFDRDLLDQLSRTFRTHRQMRHDLELIEMVTPAPFATPPRSPDRASALNGIRPT